MACHDNGSSFNSISASCAVYRFACDTQFFCDVVQRKLFLKHFKHQCDALCLWLLRAMLWSATFLSVFDARFTAGDRQDVWPTPSLLCFFGFMLGVLNDHIDVTQPSFFIAFDHLIPNFLSNMSNKVRISLLS